VIALQAQLAAGAWRPFCFWALFAIVNIFTIHFKTKQSFTNLPLFRPILTGIEAKKVFFTLFFHFSQNKM
jgi:hypothetical protein